MTDSDFDVLFQGLASVKARYIVVGGVAVVLHGHMRLTADVDLVLSLEPTNVNAALHALAKLGYRPRAPVDAFAFADAATRKSWIEEKGMTVFSLWSPNHPTTDVDIFVQEPFDFEDAFARALHVQLGETIVTVASISDLIALKTVANRPKDQEDIRALRLIEEAEHT